MWKPFQGILCLLLQITLIGWLPASLWAVFVYFSYKLDKQHKELLEAQNKD